MNLKRILLTFFILFINTFIAFAQWDENLLFDNYNVQDGLSSHIVYDIANDQDDFTWVITPNGIQRFDGKNFKNYTIKNPAGDDIIFYKHNSGLYIDQVKKLWVFCQFGLYTYNPEIDSFEPFEITDINNKRAYTSIIEHNGYYYFLSWQMLVRWNPKKNAFKKIFLKKRITATTPYGTQGLLIASPNGLQIIKRGEAKEFQLYGINLKGAGITCLYKSSDNAVWVGTYNKGIYLIKDNKIQHIKKNVDYKISKFSTYKNKIIAGTDGHGIMVFDHDGHEVSGTNLKAINGLPINSLTVDQHQRLWIATYGKGLFLHNPHKPYLRKINTDPDPNMIADHGYSSFKDSKKRILLGTNKGMVIKDKNGKKRYLRPNHFIKTFDRNESFVVNNIVEDRHHNFWVSSYGFGLFYLDGKNFKVLKSIKNFQVGEQHYNCKFILQLELYGDKLWFRLVKGTVFGMNIIDQQFSKHPLSSTSYIYYSPQQGKMYAANHEGIYEIDQEKPKQIIKSPNLSVSAIMPIDDKSFMLGTESKGVLIFDVVKKKISPIQDNQRNLLPRRIKQILKTDLNKYVIIGDNGLFTFHYNKGKISDIHEPLQKFESHQGASILNNNNIILGSYDGFYQFPLHFEENITTAPKITFNHLTVDGKDITALNSKMLDKDINLVEEVVLNHPDRGFSLNIISPEYRDDPNFFSWKLEGYEDNYSKKSTLQEINYQNLPYGSYELKIKMYSGRNTREEVARSLIISVAPPIWATTWAKVLYTIGVLILLWLIYKSYADYIQQKHLQARNTVFAEIAHELRTPLTLIQGPLQKLEEDTDLDASATRLIGMIRSNLTRLNKRITQLLDYERINQVNEELVVKEFDIVHLIKVLIRDFDPLLQKKNIEVQIDSSKEKIMVELDFDKMEKIIYNLVSNAIKYSKENDKIFIDIKKVEDQIKFSITDHGLGIPKGNQKHIFKRFYRAENVIKNKKIGSGIGLVLSYKYTSMMHGKLFFESEENKQTTFFLELPLKVKGMRNDAVPQEISHYGDEFVEKDKEKYDYRIAVAEDNEELRAFIKTSLSDSFEVEVFENGKECFDALLENDFHLVLSDVMMPVMNGYELCNQIKSNVATSHLPIIMLTALNASMYKAEGYMHGADHYVIKPFDIRMLKYRIISLIENRKALSQLYRKQIHEDEPVKVQPVVEETIDSKFLTEFKQLIETNLTDSNYNVSEICKDIGMSRPVLYRKIKALTDLSPKEYIQTKRLNHAKKMLMESDESISTIAYESGYSDPKYFSTVFKKQFGESPSEFKQHC
ncbi:hypothetical protein AVL50_04475 [Flammeovirga sp. SJP92]|nr:hypothetical protein AVL50_04475 [Flammeovirga sp. SJP92]